MDKNCKIHVTKLTVYKILRVIIRTLFKKVVLETLQESSQVFTFVDEFASNGSV